MRGKVHNIGFGRDFPGYHMKEKGITLHVMKI